MSPLLCSGIPIPWGFGASPLGMGLGPLIMLDSICQLYGKTPRALSWGCVSGSRLVSSRPLNVGVASGAHADFSHSKSFPEFQTTWFPSGWHVESSGIARIFPFHGVWRPVSGERPLWIQPRVRVGITDMTFVPRICPMKIPMRVWESRKVKCVIMALVKATVGIVLEAISYLRLALSLISNMTKETYFLGVSGSSFLKWGNIFRLTGSFKNIEWTPWKF